MGHFLNTLLVVAIVRTIILILTDILLKRTKMQNKAQRQEKTAQLFKAHALLIQILDVFGPGALAPMWASFVVHETKKFLRSATTIDMDSDAEDDDDNEDQDGNMRHGSRLSRFHDFSSPIDKLSLNRLVKGWKRTRIGEFNLTVSLLGLPFGAASIDTAVRVRRTVKKR
jgi:hypothetical protein